MEIVTRYVEDLRNVLNERSLTERRSFIKSFVREVVVTEDRVELKYKLPSSKDGTLEEDLAVPRIVRYGGGV